MKGKKDRFIVEGKHFKHNSRYHGERPLSNEWRRATINIGTIASILLALKNDMVLVKAAPEHDENIHRSRRTLPYKRKFYHVYTSTEYEKFFRFGAECEKFNPEIIRVLWNDPADCSLIKSIAIKAFKLIS
ncbi:MAG: hypothetical protein OXE99_05255 [Cellvibrionales bacterium]|nr:hypothetical protein [Cellvibrionales bacterium]